MYRSIGSPKGVIEHVEMEYMLRNSQRDYGEEDDEQPKNTAPD